ncbi:TadG family pilus assembly protein [Rhodovulum sp. DZ06]|uniref:TadG family pilus assembly protein n=1 Tax=Rhodovulum sp. DZ06 TaxID=3425126 RepID=UPI003D34294F
MSAPTRRRAAPETQPGPRLPSPSPARALPGAAAARARAAFADRSGAINIWAALAVGVGGAVGLFALDTAKSYEVQAQLAAAADAGALAGAMTLEDGAEAAGKAARAAAGRVLQDAGLAQQVKTVRIEVGGWTVDERRFVEGVDRPDAVRVMLSRAAQGGSAGDTAFLPILGQRSWTATAESVAGARTLYAPPDQPLDPCLSAGIAARGVVAAGGNLSLADACIHGAQGVSLGAGTTLSGLAEVSMADAAQLNFGETPPADVVAALEGAEALKAREIEIGAPESADELIAAYALNAQMISIVDWNPAALSDGARVYVHCTIPGVLDLPAGAYDDVHVTTNCTIGFRPGAVFANSVIGTTMDAVQGGGLLDAVAIDVLGLLVEAPKADAGKNAGKEADAAPAVEAPLEGWAISGASDVAIGAPDGCAPGGGTLLIADGDVRFGYGMGLHGSTVIAAGDVALPVAPSGLEGLAVQAGGHVGLPPDAAITGCDGTDWRIGLARRISLLR